MSIGFKQVDFAYGDTVICRGVDWILPASGVVCLWGPSGCGKTTLLRLLMGLESPSAGQVYGMEHSRVSAVFQEDRLLPWYTVQQNVRLSGCSPDAARAVLSRLGLAEYTAHFPGELSGGQQRRVALARALAAPGDLLVLDEPFNGLDEATWTDVVPLIASVAETRPVVLVTHLRQQAEALKATVVSLSGIPLTGTLSAG